LGCRKRLTLYLQLFRVGMASWNRGFTRSMSKMSKRIFLYPYAGPGGRNYLKQIGTIQEIAATGIKLEEGALLSFYCDDADDAGKRDDLIFEGTLHFDPEKQQWYALIDESSYRHASNLE